MTSFPEVQIQGHRFLTGRKPTSRPHFTDGGCLKGTPRASFTSLEERSEQRCQGGRWPVEDAASPASSTVGNIGYRPPMFETTPQPTTKVFGVVVEGNVKGFQMAASEF
jgi:hypothetical protein